MRLETSQPLLICFYNNYQVAGLVKPLDNCCTKLLGSTRTQLAESETFAGLVSPAARLVKITT